VGYEDLGELQVKNIARPVRAYRVLTDPEQAGKVVEAQKRMRVLRLLVAWPAMRIRLNTTPPSNLPEPGFSTKADNIKA